MEANEFEMAMKRIKDVTGCNTQVKLAEFLGVRQSSISDAKRRHTIPASWLLTILTKTNLNPLWILNGDPEPKFRVPGDSNGQALDVKKMRAEIEAEVRAEMDNLHAEDLMRRLKAMDLHVTVDNHRMAA
jgi:hypothetical protein